MRAMGGALRAGAGGLLAVLLLVAPVRAQNYDYTASYNGGAILFGKWNSGNQGTFQLGPSTIWTVGLQAEKWLGSGQLGLRFNGAYAKPSLPLPEASARKLGMGLGDVGLVLHLLPVTPHQPVAPYIGVGGGFVYYGLGAGDTIEFTAANARYAGKNHLLPAAVGAFGIDILTGLHWDTDPVGIRLEVADHVTPSPMKPIAGNDFSPVHNLRVVLGIFAGVGALR